MEAVGTGTEDSLLYNQPPAQYRHRPRKLEDVEIPPGTTAHLYGQTLSFVQLLSNLYGRPRSVKTPLISMRMKDRPLVDHTARSSVRAESYAERSSRAMT